MKTLITVAAASAIALASSPAFAESSDTAYVNMTGNVQKICTVVPHSGIAGSNLVGHNTYTTSDDTVNVGFDFGINNTDDPTQASIGQTNQAFFSIAFTTFCNDDFTISVKPQNGAFNNANTAPAGFTNTLPYSYTLKEIGRGSTSANGSTATTSLSSQAFHGDSQIDVSVHPSTVAPVAGDYAEKMTITFAADA